METIYRSAIEAAIEAGKKILEIYKHEDFEIETKADESPLTKADKAAHKIIVEILSKSPLLPFSPSPLPILSEEGRHITFDERSKWNKFWLVDPLDGTKEFIKKNGEFTVNIALIEAGKPIFGVVYAPVLDELYVGIVGEGMWKTNSIAALNEFEFVQRSTFDVRRQASYTVVASRSHLNEDTEEYLTKLKSEKGDIEVVSKGSSLKLCMVASGDADEYPRLGPTMEWDVAAAHAVVKASGKNVYRFESYSQGIKEEIKYNKENLLNPSFIVI